MYKHVLLPTDGSSLSMKAVMHGLALAKAVGAEATILMSTRMWSVLEMAEHAAEGEKHPVQDYEQRLESIASKVLSQCKAEADKAGVKCTTIHVTDADPDQAIVGTAKSKGCDLIVMASHSRGPVGRLLLGSVALKVLTHATVPVQVVR